MDIVVIILGLIATFGMIFTSLYAYRLYKIPKLIRSLDKTILRIVKNEYVDFSKFPKIEDIFHEIVFTLFQSVSTKRLLLNFTATLNSKKEVIQ